MFFSPEMFANKEAGIKVRGSRTDLWALGITLYYMMCGKFPCSDAKDPLHLKDLILNRPINFNLIKQEKVKDLLQKMLDKDPETRATLEEILQHPWVTQDG